VAIWAIADIHASPTDRLTGAATKPMDVFGSQWTDHVSRLETAWRAAVAPLDTVIVAGDLDWSLRLEDAHETLCLLDALPGRKVLVRGNHDYWWSSKTTNRVRRALPPSITLLHNVAVRVEGFNVCGTKGSSVPGALEWTPEDEKILRRETNRLTLSLADRHPDLPTIVAMHYPPFYLPDGISPYREMIEGVSATACVYGHLHGSDGERGLRGNLHGTEYFLVAG